VFAGHLAAALAAKRVEPRAPRGALVGAGPRPFTPLAFTHYPWSHSLSMAVIWGAVVGRVAVGVLEHPRVGLVIGLTVISHWVLDFVTHRPDLPLWPGGPLTGLGLWNSIPLTLVVEGAILAAAVAVYLRTTRARDAAGGWAFWSLVVLTTAIWVSGPFSPPPPSVTAIAAVGLALWLYPLWGRWIERHRSTR
jgi:hypothetical protein